jgi:hypothetical protein
MKKTTEPSVTREVRRIKKDPVKLTALLYLREALLNEAYEPCAEFIRVAQEFGAKDFEIQNLLEDPRRTPR